MKEAFWVYAMFLGNFVDAASTMIFLHFIKKIKKNFWEQEMNGAAQFFMKQWGLYFGTFFFELIMIPLLILLAAIYPADRLMFVAGFFIGTGLYSLRIMIASIQDLKKVMRCFYCKKRLRKFWVMQDSKRICKKCYANKRRR